MDNNRSNILNSAKDSFSSYAKKYNFSQNDQNLTSESHQHQHIYPEHIVPMIEEHKIRDSPDSKQESFPRDTYTDSINVLVLERNNLQRQLKLISNEFENYKKESSEKDEHIRKLETNVKEMEEKVKAEQAKNHSLKKEKSEVSLKNIKLKESNNGFIENLAHLNSELSEKTSQLNLKINEVSELKQSNELLFSQLAQHKTNMVVDNKAPDLSLTVSQLLKDKEILESHLLQSNKTIEDLNLKNSDYNKLYKESQDQISTLKEINKKLEMDFTTKLNKLKADNETLAKEVETSMSDRIQSRKNPKVIEELHATIQQKDAIINDLLRKSEKVDKLNEDCRTLIEKVQSDRDTISRCMEQNTKLKEMIALRDASIKFTESEKQKIQKMVEHLSTKLSRLESGSSPNSQCQTSVTDAQFYISSALDALSECKRLYNGVHFYYKTNLLNPILSKAFLNLKEDFDDICVKNEQLKKVNERLSLTADEYCSIVKDLNRNVVDLKERILFLEMNDKSHGVQNDSEPSETLDEKKMKIVEILNDEKMKLLKEIDKLRESMATYVPEPANSSVSSYGFKSEAYACLERNFNQLKHWNSLIRSQLEDLEHKNMLLSNECDTITEYVALYVTQKIALRRILEDCFHYLDASLTKSAYLFHSITALNEFCRNLLKNYPSTPGFEKLPQFVNEVERTLNLLLSHLSQNTATKHFSSFKFTISLTALPWVGFINKSPENSFTSS